MTLAENLIAFNQSLQADQPYALTGELLAQAAEYASRAEPPKHPRSDATY
jgi:hypothetical protein